MGRIGGRSHGHRSHGIGHRSHGIGHRSHGFHGRRHYGRGGRGGPSLEQQIDALSMANTAPTVVAGTLTFSGNEMSLQSQMANYMNLDQQNMAANNGNPINTANVTVVGTKAKTGNVFCACLTFMCICLIFPIFFMCCGWWKKIVNAAYEINTNTYRALGSMINFNSGVTNVNLVVADSAFNLEKATIITELLRNSRVNGFTFRNMVAKVNYLESESDDFVMNMSQVKELAYPTSIMWDDEMF